MNKLIFALALAAAPLALPTAPVKASTVDEMSTATTTVVAREASEAPRGADNNNRRRGRGK